MKVSRFIQTGGLVVLCLVGLSCGGNSVPATAHDENGHYHGFPVIKDAVAVMYPTEGNTVQGVVRFKETNGEVVITADIEGLKPNAKHAIHIHEFGDATKPDATSAGGHYNPEGHPHAGPDEPHRHAGDLGNLEADGDGKAQYELTVDNITISGEKNPILGRSVIIHVGEDDLVSQPTGDAGARASIGIIGVAQVESP